MLFKLTHPPLSWNGFLHPLPAPHRPARAQPLRASRWGRGLGGGEDGSGNRSKVPPDFGAPGPVRSSRDAGLAELRAPRVRGRRPAGSPSAALGGGTARQSRALRRARPLVRGLGEGSRGAGGRRSERGGAVEGSEQGVPQPVGLVGTLFRARGVIPLAGRSGRGRGAAAWS